MDRADLSGTSKDGEALPGWIPASVIIVALLWLLGLSSYEHRGLEEATGEWTLGGGWGRWLVISREGIVAAGEVDWHTYSASLVAEWVIVFPLLLLVAGLALTQPNRLQQTALKFWRRRNPDRTRRLPIALATGAIAMMGLAILVPGQQRTEILLPHSSDVPMVAEAVGASLDNRYRVRQLDVRAGEDGGVEIELVIRNWLFRPGPSAAELIPDSERSGFHMGFEYRSSWAAIPLGALIGLLVLLGPVTGSRKSEAK